MHNVIEKGIKMSVKAMKRYVEEGLLNPVDSTVNWNREYGQVIMQDYLDAMYDEVKATIFTDPRDRWRLDIEDASISKGMYGYKALLTILPKAPEIISGLSPQQIYQTNKDRDCCISCGKPTSKRNLLMGVINYCKDCCG